jgi:carbon monoxide dehydrogenase subunit G
MEMTGSQTLPVSRQIAWDALNDPEILKASITGCDELTRTSDAEFATQVTAAVGPVKAKFKAKLTLVDVVAPESYSIRFDGQGGVAGFGKGEAKVKLTAQGESTLLEYSAKASVGGKLAQIGSRLVDATAQKMAGEFFTKFNAELARRNPGAVAAIAAAAASAAAAGTAGAMNVAASAGAAEPQQHAGDASSGTLTAIVVALLAAVAAVGFGLSKL